MGVGLKCLLDTCTFIWLTQEPQRLGQTVQKIINDEGNALYFSHVSIWEILLKHSVGKLTLPDSPRAWISQQLSARGVDDWGIDLESLFRSAELPFHHKDPFDRLLAAQAKVHDLTIISPDSSFSAYEVKTVW